MRGPGVVDGYRANPEATAASLPRRLVPHRRLRRALGRRLPVARGAHQGADQPRRREDLAARGRGRCCSAIPTSSRPWPSRVPDAKYGETVGAAVVARSAIGEDALRAYCGERLAAFKVPAHDRTSSTRSRRARRARCSAACWPSSCREDRDPRRRRDRRLRRRGARARRRRRRADRARRAPRGAARATA